MWLSASAADRKTPGRSLCPRDKGRSLSSAGLPDSSRQARADATSALLPIVTSPLNRSPRHSPRFMMSVDSPPDCATMPTEPTAFGAFCGKCKTTAWRISSKRVGAEHPHSCCACFLDQSKFKCHSFFDFGKSGGYHLRDAAAAIGLRDGIRNALSADSDVSIVDQLRRLPEARIGFQAFDSARSGGSGRSWPA